jgi:tetratricopeptide (TPR) repeat protein
MTTSSPAYGITSTRNSIPSTDATDATDTTDTTGSAPTGTGTPVLAAAPYRASSMLQQALEAGNAGQQKTPPLSSQPALARKDAGTPASSTPAKLRHTALPANTGRESDSEHSGNTDNDGGTKDPARRMTALAARDRSSGPDHPVTAASHHGSGSPLQDQSDSAEKLEDLRTILLIKERMLGTGDVSTAATYFEIGALLQHQGKHEEAVGFFVKALAAQEGILAAKEKIVATHYLDNASLSCKIGLMLHAQGHPEQGLEYLRKAVSGATAAGHPKDAATYQGHIDSLRKTSPRS